MPFPHWNTKARHLMGVPASSASACHEARVRSGFACACLAQHTMTVMLCLWWHWPSLWRSLWGALTSSTYGVHFAKGRDFRVCVFDIHPVLDFCRPAPISTATVAAGQLSVGQKRAGPWSSRMSAKKEALRSLWPCRRVKSGTSLLMNRCILIECDQNDERGFYRHHIRKQTAACVLCSFNVIALDE